MKTSQRNLLILLSLLCAVFCGTLLVLSLVSVPRRPAETAEDSRAYLRSLQMRLVELVQKKEFSEAEIVFRRIRKRSSKVRVIQRLGSVVFFHNGKLNDAENLLKSLLLRAPDDYICRNNYGMVLFAKNRREALAELRKAWLDSGKLAFIGKNFQQCSKKFNVQLPETLFAGDKPNPVIPPDAVIFAEEKI